MKDKEIITKLENSYYDAPRDWYECESDDDDDEEKLFERLYDGAIEFLTYEEKIAKELEAQKDNFIKVEHIDGRKSPYPTCKVEELQKCNMDDLIDWLMERHHDEFVEFVDCEYPHEILDLLNEYYGVVK